MDMWDAYLKAARQVLPDADIVHDRYHISAHLNAALDRVRKDEHKRLMSAGDDTLKGSKYQLMRTYEDKRRSEAMSFRELHELDLKTSRAWHYKEDFRHFWNYLYAGAVMSSRMEPLRKMAKHHQCALAEDPRLYRASHHQRGERRPQQPHLGHQKRRKRLPLIRQIPHRHPLSMRQA